ncbi:MAG: hypothetical protein OCC45_15405 [Desulfotalea sp.]
MHFQEVQVIQILKNLGQNLVKKIKELERELRRKDKALAETAALLVFSKKLEAIWEESEEG